MEPGEIDVLAMEPGEIGAEIARARLRVEGAVMAVLEQSEPWQIHRACRIASEAVQRLDALSKTSMRMEAKRRADG